MKKASVSLSQSDSNPNTPENADILTNGTGGASIGDTPPSTSEKLSRNARKRLKRKQAVEAVMAPPAPSVEAEPSTTANTETALPVENPSSPIVKQFNVLDERLSRPADVTQIVKMKECYEAEKKAYLIAQQHCQAGMAKRYAKYNYSRYPQVITLLTAAFVYLNHLSELKSVLASLQNKTEVECKSHAVLKNIQGKDITLTDEKMLSAEIVNIGHEENAVTDMLSAVLSKDINVPANDVNDFLFLLDKCTQLFFATQRYDIFWRCLDQTIAVVEFDYYFVLEVLHTINKNFMSYIKLFNEEDNMAKAEDRNRLCRKYYDLYTVLSGRYLECLVRMEKLKNLESKVEREQTIFLINVTDIGFSTSIQQLKWNEAVRWLERRLTAEKKLGIENTNYVNSTTALITYIQNLIAVDRTILFRQDSLLKHLDRKRLEYFNMDVESTESTNANEIFQDLYCIATLAKNFRGNSVASDCYYVILMSRLIVYNAIMDEYATMVPETAHLWITIVDYFTYIVRDMDWAVQSIPEQKHYQHKALYELAIHALKIHIANLKIIQGASFCTMRKEIGALIPELILRLKDYEEQYQKIVARNNPNSQSIVFIDMDEGSGSDSSEEEDKGAGSDSDDDELNSGGGPSSSVFDEALKKGHEALCAKNYELARARFISLYDAACKSNHLQQKVVSYSGVVDSWVQSAQGLMNEKARAYGALRDALPILSHFVNEVLLVLNDSISQQEHDILKHCVKRLKMDTKNIKDLLPKLKIQLEDTKAALDRKYEALKRSGRLQQGTKRNGSSKETIMRCSILEALSLKHDPSKVNLLAQIAEGSEALISAPEYPTLEILVLRERIKPLLEPDDHKQSPLPENYREIGLSKAPDRLLKVSFDPRRKGKQRLTEMQIGKRQGPS